MLINNKSVVYHNKETTQMLKIPKPVKPEVRPHTSMHWLPLSSVTPPLTTFTYARERIYEAQSELDRIMGMPLVYEEFLAMRGSLMERRLFSLKGTNTRAAAAVDF